MLFHIPMALLDLRRGALFRLALQFLRLFTTRLAAHGFHLLSSVTLSLSIDPAAFPARIRRSFSHPIEFSPNLSQHFGLNGIVGPVPALFSQHKARIFQDLEMLGYSGFRNTKTLGCGSSAKILGQEKVKKLQSRFVGYGLQGC
jgi:hypothetical protein